ncbi:hypothetical protein PDESU_00774 [Pontiella desulfatans]|uniref:Uncharacterized protein n=1 Tax=Pontiella desulfatans TaxID=2750659 RepID=A0A6C2TXA2_PONDE|nr:putative glycoside hydrolase [Pontiella desulfatans]VGO12223.1 hypothetical protein PDESU_00774 [Pontiella desulfatans]
MKKIAFGWMACMLMAVGAGASNQIGTFWFVQKAGAGSPEEVADDLLMNNGHVITNLNQTGLSCSRVSDGDDLVYSITWTGDDFNGDATNDTFSFDLRVEGFSGSTYSYSTNAGESSMTLLGSSTDVTAINNTWGVGGDFDVDAGESLRFTVENFSVSVPGFMAEFNGAISMVAMESNGGRDHALIRGEGTNLNASIFSAPTASYAFSGMDPFVVTGAGSFYLGSREWAVSKVGFKFTVSNPSNSVVWDVSDYSEDPTGPQYIDPYPAQTNFASYPEFSWDTVPRWLALRSTTALEEYKVESVADHYQIVMLEKANKQGFTYIEDGIVNVSTRLKALNPNIRTLFYRNTVVHYGGYESDAGYDSDAWSQYTIGDDGTTNYTLIRNIYRMYNASIPELREWWLDAALSIFDDPDGMANVDGIFLDKVGGGGAPLIDGEGNFASDYVEMLYTLRQQMPANKLLTGNTLRNENKNGDREMMSIMQGSYLERWRLPDASSNPAQTVADATCVTIQLMREALSLGKIIMLQSGPIGFTEVENDDGELFTDQEAFAAAVDVALAIFLIAAEENAYFSYQNTVNALDDDWKWDSSFIEELNRPLGKPLGDPVKDGYVYTRSYEHVDVWVNVETLEAVLDWDPERGLSKMIGSDNFDGVNEYESRTINGGINGDNNLWNIVSRATVATDEVIDTSVEAGGVVALNAGDTLGFLGTNKTDNVFGMYRSGASRTLVYTFDVSGYYDLKLEMDWACSGDIADKNTSVSYSIDGGATQTVFDVGTSGVNWNETLDNGTVLDRNRRANVLTNAVSANHLTDEFQTYATSIDGAGSLLTVTIVMDSTVGGFGGFGLDNLKLYGAALDPIDFELWIANYDLSGTNATESANPDGDRYTNYEEYIAGLNPEIADEFALTGFLTGETNSMDWNAVSGRVYNVYWSSNLVHGFTLIGSNLVEGSFVDTTTDRDVQAFYKITVEREL